jgi:UDP-N-acetylmuramate dehydrogenase
MKQSDRKTLAEIVRGVRAELRFNEPMSRHTSLKVGGPADLMAVPDSAEDLERIMARAHEAGVPVSVIGGTNLLVRDGGIRGVVLKLSRLQKVRFLDPVRLEADGGALMPRVARLASERGLAGLEFGIGIPGTVGGAVVMNAGTREGQMSDVLESLRLVKPDGRLLEIGRSEMDFGYRWSRIPAGVIVTARLKLRKGRREEIQREMRRLLEYRKTTQPLTVPNAGSVFKNPNGHAAAQMIESAGLKGLRIGDAQVSDRHANFIVNRGRATARDVMRLIRAVGKTVQGETGYDLELELRIVGKD